jgi:hypothetical protein
MQAVFWPSGNTLRICLGFVVTVPLAAMLVVLAIVPVFDDLTGLYRRS